MGDAKWNDWQPNDPNKHEGRVDYEEGAQLSRRMVRRISKTPQPNALPSTEKQENNSYDCHYKEAETMAKEELRSMKEHRKQRNNPHNQMLGLRSKRKLRRSNVPSFTKK